MAHDTDGKRRGSLLGVPEGAEGDVVKKAWRAAARKWHPDSGTHPDVGLFIAARREYDSLLALQSQQPTPTPPAADDIFTLVVHDPFEFFPGPPTPGVDVRVVVPVPSAEREVAGKKWVAVVVSVPCRVCEGRGLPGCVLCAGVGALPRKVRVLVEWGVGAPRSWRVPRGGGPGVGGAAPGDLQVTLNEV